MAGLSGHRAWHYRDRGDAGRRRHATPHRDGALRGGPPLFLAFGALALLPAQSQEPVSRAGPRAGLEEHASRESDRLPGRRPLPRLPQDLSRREEAVLYAGAKNRRRLHPQTRSGGQEEAADMTTFSGERARPHAACSYSPSRPSAFILRWSVVRSRPRRSAARDTLPFVSARTRDR